MGGFQLLMISWKKLSSLRDGRAVCLFALLPGLFWNAGPDTAGALRQAGIQQFHAPPAIADSWKQAGFSATPLSDQALSARIKLTTPGIDRKVMVASATTAPWVNANGWRFRRSPGSEFWYELPPGSAPLAAAEAFAFGAKAVLKIDPADLDALGKMLQFLRTIPERNLPDSADFGFIDNGSEDAGELLNLLSRRNLLYKIVSSPDLHLRLNVAANSDDPHLFAAKVREHLTDDQRSLRIYGSEVVLCRLVGDAGQVRIHLLNYGGRPMEGIRVRVRGKFSSAKLYGVASSKPVADYTTTDGFTEFSIPVLGVYGVVDLAR
jgi:hypothetical protein